MCKSMKIVLGWHPFHEWHTNQLQISRSATFFTINVTDILIYVVGSLRVFPVKSVKWAPTFGFRRSGSSISSWNLKYGCMCLADSQVVSCYKCARVENDIRCPRYKQYAHGHLLYALLNCTVQLLTAWDMYGMYFYAVTRSKNRNNYLG